MVQIQLTISDEAMAELRAAAAKKGVTPNILARLVLNERFTRQEETEDDKTIEVRVNNYRELLGYVEERKLGGVAVFAAFAMNQYMTRNALSEAQKRRVEERYGVSPAR